MKNVKELVAKACIDIETAQDNEKYDNRHDIVGGLLHQAVEKLLKAILKFHDAPFSTHGSTGHDIKELMRKVSDMGLIPFDEFRTLLNLNVYHSGSRYEFVEDEDRQDLKKMIRLCNELKIRTFKIVKLRN